MATIAPIRNNLEAPQPHVLIATPDTPYANALQRFMEMDLYVFDRCHDAKGVLRLVGRHDFDVLILDLELNEGEDLDLVSFVRKQSPQTRIVLIFDIDQVERAMEGIRHGAFFYLPKSCQPSDVSLIVTNAMKISEMESSVQEHERKIFEDLVGQSPAMRRIVEVISKVAPTNSTVLLLGESGSGKEILADAIHRLSPRRSQPLVALNCAALPEQLLESEMFGHVKGAFTSADTDKKGLFEEADGGTLFLDEIGDLALASQAKLLRVLQNGEIRPVGSSTTRHVDVRLLAATNRNLVESVSNHEFREDLYFRLNVIQIAIPPLRERVDALPSLVNQFLKASNQEFGRNIHTIEEPAWAAIKNYPFPGNVRELESIIAHAVILSEGDTILLRDLPDAVRFGEGSRLALPGTTTSGIPSLESMEERLIRQALETLDGNQTEAARQLGISRSTLWRKMKEYGLSKTAGPQ